MIPALVTPIKLLLRRISFICCACMILACMGCFDFDIPDQHPIVNIYIDNITKNNLVKFDTLAVYDTSASTLTCRLHFGTSIFQYPYIPVILYKNGKQVSSRFAVSSIVKLGRLNAGTYDLQIGDPDKYPCYNIHNLCIPPEKNCELNVYKIPKP